ncbi:tetratricopeptide repeat protein [Neobacillus sp. BF23-41]|uniref:tetratricopeptide repeat protein n=1 Tax=Neobacillus sp. BF23-41 TaxID=3240280 RepID=UPI0034E3D9A8
MDNKLIMPTEMSIKDKKHNVKGNIIRAAVFTRSKVIEVMTADQERYYLIYYKNSLIFGEKLDRIEEGTFIDKAFHEGIIIESPHPLLSALIPLVNVTIPNKNNLFSQLQIHYSLQEMVYILTTLDSFFQKEQLIKIIDKVFFHFRRNGKFMKSFQIIQMLADFTPTLKSAQERLASLEFSSYNHFYHSSSLPVIQMKDPLYVELYCFKNRTNPDERILLEEIVSKQDDLVELLLWLENAGKSKEAKSIEKYTSIALRFVTMEEWMLILAQLNINPFLVLPDSKSFIKKMLKDGNYEKAALCILDFIDDMPASYDAILLLIWENSDPSFVIEHLDEFIKLLQHLPHAEKTRQFEQKVFQFAEILLKEHDLKTVHEKLIPIQKVIPDLDVIRKISEMVNLLEDPDRMMELGDYYAEFKQFDQAIDCFFWEMELQPQNPSPVRKISKMYQSKGMVKEASAYQKIFAQLKSNQEIG